MLVHDVHERAEVPLVSDGVAPRSERERRTSTSAATGEHP